MSVCKEFLPRNPTLWDCSSKRKITPAEQHRTTSNNGQCCCRKRAPPSASFGNISAKNQATKPALEPNWAPGFDAYCCHAPSPISPVCISTGIPSAEPAARRQRQKRRRDDEGSGGATRKAAAARQQRQKRWRDNEGSGSAMTKAAAAR